MENTSGALSRASKIRLLAWVVVIIISLAAITFQIIHRKEKYGAAIELMENEVRAAKPVEVMKIVSSDWEVWRSYYGRVRSAKTMRVVSFVRETVAEVHVNVGDSVRAGQVLLSLRREDQAANARAGDAALNEAKSKYNRLLALCAEGGVSQMEVDRAYAVMKSEEAISQSYKSALKQTRMLSQIDGIVTARNIEPGELAEAGQTLLEIENQSGIEVELMVSVHDIAAITGDTPVNVIIGGTSLSGRVTRVNPKATPGSGLCPVTVSLAPGAGAVPGAYLEGSLLVRRERNAITIPSHALFSRGDERFVYVADGIGGERIARLTKVDAENGNNGRVLVTSGLKPGDLLITSGNRGIADGVPVSCDMAPVGGGN
ncbi:MAG: efflux RND transporter periplasmic adaptor subunit [Synergistaceae bacterium]|nr:efflux RND transporter periplasmic adaptor subunit [Synergistaceae bacterium]